MKDVNRVVWLMVGVAAAVAAHFLVDVRTDRAPKGLGRNALVPAAEQAMSIVIVRSGESATRLDLDGIWKISSPFDAVADRRTVLRMVDALAYAPVAEEMTDAELLRLGRTREDFGLDRPRVVVSVTGRDGKPTTVSFGQSTPVGDGVYVTMNGEDTVYVVPSNVLAVVDLPADRLRRRRLFALTPESVESLDIRKGAGRFLRFARDGGTWRLVEPHTGLASSSRIREFLNVLLALEAKDFVWSAGLADETRTASVSLLAGYGLDGESALSVLLKTADGKARSVSFGREAGSGLVYALTDEGRSVVTVPTAVSSLASEGVSAFVDLRLFPMEPKAVKAISIEDGGTTHLLSRGSDDTWRLDAPISAAADAKAVASLVARLLSLNVSDLASEGVRVSVGTNAEPVYVSRAALLSDARLEDLRSKTVVRVDPKLLKRIVATDYGAKPVAVVFDSERGVWTVESAEGTVVADGEAAGRLSAALNPLNAVRIARLKVSTSDLGLFGLDKPQRTVAVDQSEEGSVRRNVLIGDVTDGGRYATLGSSDAVFVISTESAAALLAPVVK